MKDTLQVKQDADGAWYVSDGAGGISQDFSTREEAEAAVEHDVNLCDEQGIDLLADPDGGLLDWE